jgi:hypothetical protein
MLRMRPLAEGNARFDHSAISPSHRRDPPRWRRAHHRTGYCAELCRHTLASIALRPKDFWTVFEEAMTRPMRDH